MTDVPKKIDLPFNLRATFAPEEDKADFFTAARRNDIPTLEKFLQKWPDAAEKWRTKDLGAPVILTAVNNLNTDTLVFLLQHGADINGFNGSKTHYPLYWAAHSGEVKQIELLLTYGADINLQSGGTRQTALMVAVEQQKKECADLLAICGADLSLKNHCNKTALDLADDDMKEVILAAQKRLQDYLARQQGASAAVIAAAEDPDSIKTTSEIIVPKPLMPQITARGTPPETQEGIPAEPAKEATPEKSDAARKPFWKFLKP